MNVSTKRL